MTDRASTWFTSRRYRTRRKPVSIPSFHFSCISRFSPTNQYHNYHNTPLPLLSSHPYSPFLRPSKIYIVFLLIILVSTAGGVVYAVLKADTSTGLSIATYVLTCMSLALALVAAGQWFGLKKPDSFSFAYDVERNQVVSETYVNQVFGGTAGSASFFPTAGWT